MTGIFTNNVIPMIPGGDQAGDISKLLLMTLVTNLAELIGHQLTIGILSASWNLEEQDLKDEELGDDR